MAQRKFLKNGSFHINMILEVSLQEYQEIQIDQKNDIKGLENILWTMIQGGHWEP